MMMNLDDHGTQRLFIYGTLQHDRVQVAVLGRTVEMVPHLLLDFRKAWLLVSEGYPIAIPEANNQISGQIIELTHKELTLIDLYEGEAYLRIQAKLVDGTQIWVYRNNPYSRFNRLIEDLYRVET